MFVNVACQPFFEFRLYALRFETTDSIYESEILKRTCAISGLDISSARNY